MFPRRTSFNRLAVVALVSCVCVWVWISSPDSPPLDTPWADSGSPDNREQYGGEGVRSGEKSGSSGNRIVTEPKHPHLHHNGNMSLENLRDNMTLGGVNMSGILDLIREANASRGHVVMHHHSEHTNVPNPHDFRYLINSPNICKDKDMFLIIYIHTAPSHHKRRMVIRETWGNPKYYPDTNLRLIFVLGKSSNASETRQMQDALEFENEQYHDIVQEDFMDSYKNLTYKGIAALKWISNYCPQAKFVLKTDDDIFVNMFTLLRHLKSMDKIGSENKGLILCLVWNRMKVMRTGKWKVDESEFKDDYYPTYCSGSAFVFSTDVAIRLHEVSYHVPFFWVDDFYVTGLLPLKAGNINHKQFMSTYVLDGRKLEEKFTGPQWFTYIYSHVHDLNKIQSVWDRLVLLAAGKHVPAIPFAFPGQLPDEAALFKKERDEEKRKMDEQKKKNEAKKKKVPTATLR